MRAKVCHFRDYAGRSRGFFDGLVGDEPAAPFKANTFWDDQEAKRNGAKGAQQQ